ncbi:MAG: hypothetical protein HY401_10555 [Elusimicrobia bacterium]|nr:hypothetical protein [Elusimicrobiota bacterium]
MTIVQFFCLSNRVKAEESSANVAIEANVAKENKEEFIYDYKLSYRHNDDPSLLVGFFLVDLRNNPQEHSLTYDHANLEYSDGEHYVIFEKAPRVYPVKKQGPSLWTHASAMEKPYHGWWSCPIWTKEGEIKPGQKLSGFGFVAKEPPGIRGFIVNASNDIDNKEEYSGQTISPVAPPDPLTASAWTARMLSDAAEARKLGWIKSDQQLEKIKKLISDLNTQDKKKLKKSVQNIEKYVSREHEAGRLTDEADALVRLNALYLWNRLHGKNSLDKKELKK